MTTFYLFANIFQGTVAALLVGVSLKEEVSWREIQVWYHD